MRTTVQADLVAPNGLVEISAVAVPNGGERTVIHPAGWAPALDPFSYGIKTGNTLFLAGLVARNGKDNSPVEGPMAVQTKAVLDNGAEILKAAGMGFEHVVSSRVFITDATMFQEMNGVYRTYFPKDTSGARHRGGAAHERGERGGDHYDRRQRSNGLHDARGRRHARQAEPAAQ